MDALTSHPGGHPGQAQFKVFVCTVHIRSVEFWINFFTMKDYEYLSQIWWDYCLDTCLPACKRISLDGNYFWLILMLKLKVKITLF